MTETILDAAHAAMEAAPEDDAARLRFYERLADAELVLMLTEEPLAEQVSPQVFELDEGSVVLAFDREERLAAFAEGGAPYAAMSGRVLVAMLAGQGLGLGLNLGVAPSSILIPPAALAWLSETLAHAPSETEERPEKILPPAGLPETLVTALDAKLPAAAGLARFVYLAAVHYAGGRRGHVLAFIDPVPGAQGSLARAASEALVFSGVEAGEMDVAFFAAADPVSARLARVALRFDLPEPAVRPAPAAPGMDPDNPPRLR